MIHSIPLKDTSTPIMIYPFMKNGKGGEVSKGGKEIEWIVEECRCEGNEPDHAENKRVECDADGKDETALGSNGVGMADM